ncbi:hypothetical protein PCL_07026 [Purpureocillium lilacinum]|uniref:RING-type domain-containing protein n=1 Tax=Purpureocillium lilacinum TaxID=33203 RepID=A0A2U3DT48_PURLI|nr:hypothetical protein PCL_07026 [Purpureocillium lilacinum]
MRALRHIQRQQSPSKLVAVFAIISLSLAPAIGVTLDFDIQHRYFRRPAQMMDATILIRADIARHILESDENIRPLEALWHMARAVRDWSRAPEESRQGYGRPSFGEAQWKQLASLLPKGLALYDTPPEEADTDTCECCTRKLDKGYTVSLPCGHWFRGECIARHLMEREQCPVEKCFWQGMSKKRTLPSKVVRKSPRDQIACTKSYPRHVKAADHLASAMDGPLVSMSRDSHVHSVSWEREACRDYTQARNRFNSVRFASAAMEY